MGREFELKYRANDQIITAIREKFQDFTLYHMSTAYYDTPGSDFGSRRWTLRRRMENDRSVCTLKTPLPDGSRGEWETECGSIENAIDTLCKLGAPAELSALAQPGLRQVCAARFARLAVTLELGACTVELALDQGQLMGGRRQLPFAEVEVELKEGSEAAAVRFAEALAGEFGLVLEPKSKVQRAMELI